MLDREFLGFPLVLCASAHTPYTNSYAVSYLGCFLQAAVISCDGRFLAQGHFTEEHDSNSSVRPVCPHGRPDVLTTGGTQGTEHRGRGEVSSIRTIVSYSGIHPKTLAEGSVNIREIWPCHVQL